MGATYPYEDPAAPSEEQTAESARIVPSHLFQKNKKLLLRHISRLFKIAQFLKQSFRQTLCDFARRSVALRRLSQHSDSSPNTLDPHSATCCPNQHRQPRSQQAHSAGFRNCRRSASATGDGIALQRHCAISRQRTPASDGGTGIQGNSGERKYISFERSACTESRGAADLPEDVRVIHRLTGKAIDKNNRRGASGRKRTAYLKNKQCTRGTLESQRHPRGQICRTTK